MSATKVHHQTPSQRVPPTPGKSIGRLFAKPDFDPSGFCLNVLKNGKEEVDDVARAASSEMAQAELQLHEAVYASEGLSVTASRQLRAAQADVCLLSSRLSEQRSEIGKLIAAPLFSSEATGQTAAANLRRNSNGDDINTSASGGGGGLLAEKVEGCGFLGDSPGRGLLFDGQLTELDPHPPHQPLRRIHMYLLTDCIVTAVVPQHHPRVVVRNRFDRQFPLDHVAVTAAAPPAPSTRLRLLSFPESRLFDTDSADVRKAWLNQIDIAKRSRSRARSQQDSSMGGNKSPPKQDDMVGEDDGKTSTLPTAASLDSLQEALDELDVLVAERDLEAAVDSLLSIRKEWRQNATGSSSGCDQQQQPDNLFSDSQTAAATNRLRQRQSELVFLLFRDLDTSVTRGAFLDARLAVTLLCRIDKAAEATHRLLGHGTTILRSRVLQHVNFGSGSSSAVTLSRQLAENMANTGFATIGEFVEVIRGALGSCGFGLQVAPAPTADQNSSNVRIVNATVLASCTAALTAWVGSQTNWLTAQVYNQITNDQQQQQLGPNLQTLADCADLLRRAVNSQAVFAGVGLDLWPLVELFLAPFTTAAVKQAQAVLIESIKKHLVLSSSQTSTPPTGNQQKQPLTALPSTFVAKIGQDALAKHFQTCSIVPPNRVVQFSDAILTFSTQICSLYSTAQHTALCRAVTTVLRAAADQLAANKRPDRSNDEILASFRFLFGPVLDRIMTQFRKISKLETRDFVQLQKDCYGGSPPPQPPPTTTASATVAQSPSRQISTPTRSVSPKTKTSDSPRRIKGSGESSSPVPKSRDRPPTPKKNPDEFV